jgi:hypothetical protein
MLSNFPTTFRIQATNSGVESNKYKKLSEKTKYLISESLKGEFNPFYNKSHNNESIAK